MPLSASARMLANKALKLGKGTMENYLKEPKKMAKNMNMDSIKSATNKLKTAFVKGWPGKMLHIK